MCVHHRTRDHDTGYVSEGVRSMLNIVLISNSAGSCPSPTFTMMHFAIYER